MKKLIIPIIVAVILAAGIGAFFILQKPAFSEPPSTTMKINNGKILFSREEQDILTGSNERIEKYRKASAVLNIVTEDGRPVNNASVEIEQQDHEFLFGLNNSVIMQALISSKKYGTKIPKSLEKYDLSMQDIDNYLEKFFGFANYTTLGGGWNMYENKKGEIDNRPYDAAINELHEHGIKVRAHSLVWNSNTPDWVPDDCDGLMQAIEKRIRDFLAYYNGKFDYFILANEAANPFRPIFKDDKMTPCIKKIGKHEFFARFFKIARETAPAAKLMINECSVFEKQGFSELLEALKDTNGQPLYDIIGIQSHMHQNLWTLDRVWKVAEGYSKFGVPIHFTEVTVLSGMPISGKGYDKEGKVLKQPGYEMKTTPEGEKIQAEYAANLYTVLFSHPAVEGIMWWNLTDHGSWKNAPAGLLRDDMSSKPAYNALMDLIKKKWWTKVQTKTPDNGRAEFRGFLGTYKVTVTPKDGQPKTFSVNLSKEGVREFKLEL